MVSLVEPEGCVSHVGHGVAPPAPPVPPPTPDDVASVEELASADEAYALDDDAFDELEPELPEVVSSTRSLEVQPTSTRNKGPNRRADEAM